MDTGAYSGMDEGTVEVEAAAPWGRLVSVSEGVPHVDLGRLYYFTKDMLPIVDDEYKCGRRQDAHEFMCFQNPEISGHHCRMYRVKRQVSNAANVGEGGTSWNVFVEDTSSNGTFVNGTKIGKGSRTLIKNGDEVSLAVASASVARRSKKTAKFPFVAYVFHDLLMEKTEDGGKGEDGGISDKYFVQETLGTGNFAAVKLGIRKTTGEQVAIKLIDKRKFRMASSLRKEQLMDEVNVLRKLEHPNIIGIHDIFDGERYLYIVLELASGGDLFDRIVEREGKRYPEEEARLVFRGLVSAVQFMHGHGIAHRDIKPENVLLSTKESHTNCKLSDFGLAKVVGEQEYMSTLCGTPGYLAPEILLAERGTTPRVTRGTPQEEDAVPAGKYTLAVDIWSLGVVLYVLLSGQPPFYDMGGRPTLFERITKGIYALDGGVWDNVSDAATSLIRSIFTVNPRDRPTIDQVWEHPWMQQESDTNVKRERSEEEKPTGKRRKQ